MALTVMRLQVEWPNYTTVHIYYEAILPYAELSTILAEKTGTYFPIRRNIKYVTECNFTENILD